MASPKADGPLNLRRIAVSDRPGFAANADLLSLLAYPNPDSEEERQKFGKSVRNFKVSSALKADPDWDPQIALHSHTELPGENLNKALLAGCRVVDDRLNAAKQVIPWIAYSEGLLFGRKLKPQDAPRLSRDHISSTIADQELERGVKTQGKIWKESLPVIHLSAAVFVECERLLSPPRNIPAAFQLATYLDIPSSKIITAAVYYRRMLLQLEQSENMRGPNAIPRFPEDVLLDLVPA